MADPFAPVQPNQPVVFSATAWNAMLAAGKAYRANQLGSASDPLTTTRSSSLIRVLNDTGTNLEQGQIVGLEEPIFVPEETSVDAFLREVTFIGVTPTTDHIGKFAVLMEPAPPDVVVRAWVAGVCMARVNVVDETHTYADVEDGETGALKSSFDGTAQILWKEGDIPYGYYYGGGEQWAIVRLGCRPSEVGIGSVTQEIGKATSVTRPGTGKIKIYTTLDMTTSPPTYGGLTADEYDCLSFNLDKKIEVGANVPINRILGQWHAVNVDSCEHLES